MIMRKTIAFSDLESYNEVGRYSRPSVDGIKNGIYFWISHVRNIFQCSMSRVICNKQKEKKSPTDTSYTYHHEQWIGVCHAGVDYSHLKKYTKTTATQLSRMFSSSPGGTKCEAIGGWGLRPPKVEGSYEGRCPSTALGQYLFSNKVKNCVWTITSQLGASSVAA